MFKLIKDVEKLRQKSEDVASVDEAKDIIGHLIESLGRFNNGVGLSAIQIGFAKRVAVIKEEDSFHAIINPKILLAEDKFTSLSEGCLSFEGKFHDVPRYRHFIIRNNVIDGDNFRFQDEYYFYDLDKDSWSSGVTAIAVQHEIDHFDGKLIIDHPKVSERSPIRSNKVGRNDPCPCGENNADGKTLKFKKCSKPEGCPYR